MSPRSSNDVPVSSLGIKPVKHRNSDPLKRGDVWLQDRSEIEGTEGLWRLHDNLYDLNDFINKHPGGAQWIQLSKGTDITEAYEVHHLSDLPDAILKKYFARKATTPRNNPFSFKDDGFYRTLKREVIKDLKKIPQAEHAKQSDLMTDGLMLTSVFLSVLAVRMECFWLCPFASYFLTSMANAAHNYYHQKDNFRMYYWMFMTNQIREWRIIHVLSHHLLTNTVNDLEISNLEPERQYLPVEKPTWIRIGCFIYSPILYAMALHRGLINRYKRVYQGDTSHIDRSEIFVYTIPIIMYIFGGQPLWYTFIMWNIILMGASFLFELIGLNAAHHHPDIFHDGDTPRKTPEIDWGIHQLDAVMDRTDVTGNAYLVLTVYGDHALHHLFPTLDHGTLAELYPTFKKVLKQFDINLRMTSQWDLVKGQFKQLARREINPNPPDLLDKYAPIY